MTSKSHLQNLNSLNILAIDTSLDSCSVALMTNNSIFENYQLAPKQQTKLILSMIDQLLLENNLNLRNINLLAFTHGPGSFTGTRIAAGIIQGIALTGDLPVIPVSTLQVLAQGCLRQYGATNTLVCLDARMKEIHWGVYQKNNEHMQAVIIDSLCSPEKLPQINKYKNLNPYFAIGNGWNKYSNQLQNQLPFAPEKTLFELQPSAADVITIAIKTFSPEKNYPAENAVPIYLRDEGIWKKTCMQS